MSTNQTEKWVLQFCHGYDGPFLDCARQYAAIFSDTHFKVCTVYLTGTPSAEVERGSSSDEVIFLNFSSKEIRGLKLSALQKLGRIVRERNFQFCIAHRFKPIYISLLATKLPVIGIHHAFGVYDRSVRRMFVSRFRSRLLLVGVSNAVRDEIRARLPRWETSRIATLYNRIDLAAVQSEQLSRTAARGWLGLPNEAWITANVGRLHPDKDQETLIRGFAAALPRLRQGSLLVIIGEGRLESRLKELTRELGIGERVRFLGQVKHARRYFQAFDVFALTSDHEPFGMVLLEAMAAGVPLITTDCGGAAEIVQGCGELFPLRDIDALAERLYRSSLLTGPDLVSRQALMEKKVSEYFSDDVVRTQFFKLLEGVTSAQ